MGARRCAGINFQLTVVGLDGMVVVVMGWTVPDHGRGDLRKSLSSSRSLFF